MSQHQRLILVASLLLGYLQYSNGWCLKDENGPCILRISSKAGNKQPRGIAMVDESDKEILKLQSIPDESSLKVFFGDDKIPSFQVDSMGMVGIGRVDQPLFQIDSKNDFGPAFLSLQGSPSDTKKPTAGVRFSERNENAASFVYRNRKIELLGNLDPNSGEGMLSVDVDAPVGSFVIDEWGNVQLTQSSNLASVYPRLRFQRSHGQPHSHEIVRDDDTIGSMEFNAFDGRNMLSVASIKGRVQVRGNQAGGVLEFSTKALNENEESILLTMNEQEASLSIPLRTSKDILLQEGSIRASSGSVLAHVSVETEGKLVAKQGVVLKSGDFEIQRGKIELIDGVIHVHKGDMFLDQGKISVNGPLRVKESAHIDDNLRVEGNFKLEGNMEINGELNSIIDAGLQVGSGINITAGNLEVQQGHVLVRGSLEIRTDTEQPPVFSVDTIQQNIIVDANMYVGGQIMVQDGKVYLRNSNLIVDGQESGQGDASISGTLAVGNQAQFASRLIVHDVTESTSTETGSLVTLGGIGVEKSITIGDSLQFSSPETNQVIRLFIDEEALLLDNKLRVDGAMHASAGLVVSSSEDNAIVALKVDGKSLFDDGAEFQSDVTVRGSASIGAIESKSIRAERGYFGADVSNDEISKAASLMTDSISVTSQLDTQNIIIHKNLVLESNSTLTCRGSQQFESEDNLIFLSIRDDNVHISPNTTIQNRLQVHGLSSFADDVEIQGALYLNEISLSGADSSLLIDPHTGTNHVFVGILNASLGFKVEANHAVVVSEGLEMQGLHTLIHTSPSIEMNTESYSLRLNANGMAVVGAMGGKRILNLNTSGVYSDVPLWQLTSVVSMDRLCVKSQCFDEVDGTMTVGTHMTLENSKNGTIFHGPAVFNEDVAAKRGVVQGTSNLAIQNGKENVLDPSSFGGFVIVDCPSPEGSMKGPALLKLLSGASMDGRILTIKNNCLNNRLIVKSQDDQIIQLSAGSIAQVIGHDSKWHFINNRLLVSAELENIEKIVSTNTLDIGAVSVSSISMPSQKRTDISFTTLETNGTLTSSPILQVLQNNTLVLGHTASISVHSPIAMHQREIREAKLVGGSFTSASFLQTTTSLASRVLEVSDRKQMRNIKPIPDVVPLVSRLQGVYYDDENGKGRIGMIASDVSKVVPQVVHKDPQSKEESIEYSRLVPLLLESVKQLNAKITQLESKIETLQKTIKK